MLSNVSERYTSDELNKIGEICKKFKHTRDKFSLSSHQASNIFLFDLL